MGVTLPGYTAPIRHNDPSSMKGHLKIKIMYMYVVLSAVDFTPHSFKPEDRKGSFTYYIYAEYVFQFYENSFPLGSPSFCYWVAGHFKPVHVRALLSNVAMRCRSDLSALYRGLNCSNWPEFIDC